VGSWNECGYIEGQEQKSVCGQRSQQEHTIMNERMNEADRNRTTMQANSTDERVPDDRKDNHYIERSWKSRV